MKVICVYSARNDTSFMGDLGLADKNLGDDHRPAGWAMRMHLDGLQLGCRCTDPVSPIGQVLEVCSLMVTEHGTLFTGTSNIAGASGWAAGSPVREAWNACVDRRQPWAQSPPALKAL